jgi:hypothetical protein
VALFQAKKTVAEIVKATGVGRGSVYRALEAAGLHTKRAAQEVASK